MTSSGELKMVGDMAFEKIGTKSLDYMPWRYGGSKLLFRGPARCLNGNYALFLGGTETYGKFIETPFPARLEEMTGIACINFGWPNAGVDVFLNDAAILDAARRAQAVVLQVPCAVNMTNRFYSVHPRRNDRVVEPSDLLKSLFHDVDFTEFHFTRHMLIHLQAIAPDRFALIRGALQETWVSRMRLLLSKIGENVILLWFSARKPGRDNTSLDVALDPAFVTRRMLEAVSNRAASLVTVCVGTSAQSGDMDDKIFSDMEASAAAEVLGPKAHDTAADALFPVITDMTDKKQQKGPSV